MAESRLQPIGERLWLVEGPLVSFYGFPYNTRSVIARLEAGELWVWSPVELEAALHAEVTALGTVAHLVSPNPIHHLYLQDWSAAWPAARLWGPRSTIDKRRDLDFAGVLDDAPPAAWAGEIEQVWFRGSPLLDEIVFFHRPSRTAVLADLSENFEDAFLRRHWSWWQRPIARLWKIVEPYGYAPLEWRLSWRDRAPARRALKTLLGWAPEQVVMAHGAWQAKHGTAYLRRALAWLDGSAGELS